MGWHLLSRFVLFKVIIDNIRILGIELELACNRSSCGGISLKIFACEKIAPHEPRLQASSSSNREYEYCLLCPLLTKCLKKGVC